MSIGGTYDEPVAGLAFEGIRFSGTSWLGPSTDGYANQQNGAFLKGEYEYRPEDGFTTCSRGCEMFERARNEWYQEPAAVQVSAASDVTFTRNTFSNLGQSALGIGNDANATLSGVGLGASNVARHRQRVQRGRGTRRRRRWRADPMHTTRATSRMI